MKWKKLSNFLNWKKKGDKPEEVEIKKNAETPINRDVSEEKISFEIKLDNEKIDKFIASFDKPEEKKESVNKFDFELIEEERREVFEPIKLLDIETKENEKKFDFELPKEVKKSNRWKNEYNKTRPKRDVRASPEFWEEVDKKRGDMSFNRYSVFTLLGETPISIEEVKLIRGINKDLTKLVSDFKLVGEKLQAIESIEFDIKEHQKTLRLIRKVNRELKKKTRFD